MLRDNKETAFFGRPLVYLLDIYDYFFAVGFFTGAFLATGFFAVTAFLTGALATGFLAAAGFAVTAGFAAFLEAPIFTPASLATLAKADLRRAAVALGIKFFLTAVSISLCALLRPSLVGFARKILTAPLMSRFVETFRSRRFAACLTRLMADLMIGMLFLYLLELIDQSTMHYRLKQVSCKVLRR